MYLALNSDAILITDAQGTAGILKTDETGAGQVLTRGGMAFLRTALGQLDRANKKYGRAQPSIAEAVNDGV